MNKKFKKGYAVLSVLATGLLASCGSSVDSTSSAGTTYTYNTYLETNPKTWNVHNWQTNDESYVTSFTEIGFYDCILNDTKDGYKFVTEMASEFPVDVTEEVAANDDEYEKYGYASMGNISSNLVWDIALNENAVWEDGTPIKADDYVESLKRQLDPKMVNFRADSYYASSFVIANAERYFKQGNATIEPLYSYIKNDGSYVDENVAQDGMYYINLGIYNPLVGQIFSNADDSTTLYTVFNQLKDEHSDEFRLACHRIIDACGSYLLNCVDHTNDGSNWKDATKVDDIKDDMWNYNIDIENLSDDRVKVRANLQTSALTEPYSAVQLRKDLNTFMKGQLNKTASWAYQLALSASIYNDYEQVWDGLQENEDGQLVPSGVGIRKLDDYKIRIYLAKAISALDLKFALGSTWLVKTDLYDRLTVTTGGKKSTTYASDSINNYMSYGPYKLTKYESGKTITMEKNENWYGYTDGKHVNQFQMTGIKTQIVTDHNTAVQMFEKGNLDDLTMNKTDMKKYGNSSRKTTTYESYTQKISMNSNRAKLLSRQSATSHTNKTVLANDDFRKGLSLSFNRNNFASQTTAGSKAFTGLLNDLYLTNNLNGESYRSTAAGKGVYNEVYGKLGGDPYLSTYDPENPTALSAAANGYNAQMGIYYVEKALKAELESTQEGHLLSGDTIDLEFRVYDDTSETTIDMMNFLTKAISDVIAAATKKLQEADPVKYGSLDLSFNLTVTKDENYYDTAKTGGYEMIFSTWGGAAINPYGLMQVYCDSTFDSCCEYGFKGKQDKVTLSIDVNEDGEITNNETKTFNEWYTTVNGNEYTEQDQEAADFNQEEFDEIHQKKIKILAGMEVGIINRFEAVPLVARGTSSLTSFKVENGSTTYVSLVGYGGVRFLTFNYTDAEWNALITSDAFSADLYKD